MDAFCQSFRIPFWLPGRCELVTFRDEFMVSIRNLGKLTYYDLLLVHGPKIKSATYLGSGIFGTSKIQFCLQLQTPSPRKVFEEHPA